MPFHTQTPEAPSHANWVKYPRTARQRAVAVSRFDHLYAEGAALEAQAPDAPAAGGVPFDPLARFLALTDAYPLLRHCPTSRMIISLPHGARHLYYFLDSPATRCRLKALYYRTYGTPCTDLVYVAALDHLRGRALAGRVRPLSWYPSGERLAARYGLPDLQNPPDASP